MSRTRDNGSELKIFSIHESLLRAQNFSVADWKEQFENVVIKETAKMAAECKQIEELVDDLLVYVVNGQLKEAETLIKKDPGLSLLQSSVIEERGRSWKNISAIEFAEWAGDVEMRDMLINALPQDQKHKAHKQIADLSRNGTEYGLPLAPFKVLIKEYREIAAQELDSPGIDWYWRTRVGAAQRMLPIVMWQMMCSPDQTGTLKRVCKLNDGSVLDLSFVSELGSKYALARGANAGLEKKSQYDSWAASYDLGVFLNFCEQRGYAETLTPESKIKNSL